jgi:pentatricopeptide repeat protein
MKLEGMKPNSATFPGVVNSCAIIVALEEGRHAHQQIIQSGYESNVNVQNSLIDMYAKCRSMEGAWRVFNKMASHHVVSWNIMILGHLKNNLGCTWIEVNNEVQTFVVDDQDHPRMLEIHAELERL